MACELVGQHLQLRPQTVQPADLHSVVGYAMDATIVVDVAWHIAKNALLGQQGSVFGVSQNNRLKSVKIVTEWQPRRMIS
tara:strand:- start:275 stop:514 length:240 start_codon:yes stop_codon:yes gene_type:complete